MTQARTHTLSFEVMPPRSLSSEPKFMECLENLVALSPDFLSMTYGAAGQDRYGSLEAISGIVRDTPVLPVAHLTCVGTPRSDVETVAREFLENGVRMFLALRGDPPLAGAQMPEPDQCVRDSAELVYLLRSVDRKLQRTSSVQRFKSLVRPLTIAVAAFPDGNPALGTSPDQEVTRLLEKQDAGADFAITQLFYSPAVFDYFMKLATRRGVTIPVIAGIIPQWNPERLMRCADVVGIRPPARLIQQFADAKSEEAREAAGLEFWGDLAKEAIESGSPGLHLFTFNNWEPAAKLVERIGLK